MGDCFKQTISGILSSVACISSTLRGGLLAAVDDVEDAAGEGRAFEDVGGVERVSCSGVEGVSWNCGGDMGVGNGAVGSGMDDA